MSEHSHGGHKKRMRQRFVDSIDFKGFSEHEILEMILSYAIIRGDTNNLAHRLIDHFGSFNDVLKAPVEKLCEVEGIGERCATLINMQYSLLRYYNSMQVSSYALGANIHETALKQLVPLFARLSHEKMYVATIDSSNKIKRLHKIAEGSVSTCVVSPRDLVRMCIDDATISAVIIAHNHPGGKVYPSQQDIDFTRKVVETLNMIDVTVLEHYVVCEDCYYPIIKNHIIEVKERIKINEESNKNA